MALRLENLFIIVVAIFGFNMAQASTPAALEIHISPLDSTHIKLSYSLPKNSLAVRFLHKESGFRSVRSNWVPLNECAKIVENEIVFVQTPCAHIDFSVPILAEMKDRMYPTAYPFNEQGVLIHTGAFALETTESPIKWTFSSPAGAIIINGESYAKKITVEQHKNEIIKYTGVFLSYLPREKYPKVIATQDTPEWVVSGVANAAKQVTAYYLKTYPRLAFKAPTLFVSNRNTGNPPNFQADVSSHRMIRFAFTNYPSTLDSQLMSDIKSTVAHEFAHVLQPEMKLRKPFVTEGGAEFVRWMAEYKLGFKSDIVLAEEFSQALFNCSTFLNGRAWSALGNEDLNKFKTPYECGLSLHVLGLASRQNNASSEALIENYYVVMKSQPDIDFAQYLTCGNSINCQPDFLSKVFTSKEKFLSLIDEQLYKLGVVKGRSVKESQSDAINVFNSLLEEDCGVASGYWAKPDGFLTDGVPQTCKHFKDGLFITGVGGYSYAKNINEAIKSQNESCLKNHYVLMNVLNGSDLRVPCSREYKKETFFSYEIDIKKMFALLEKKPI